MREKYKNLSNSPSDSELIEWLRQATRERDIDLEDYQNQVANNPFVFNAPSSTTDLIGTEKAGDIAVDDNYIYVVVDNSGTLEWKLIPLTEVITNDRSLQLNDGIITSSTTVANTTTETTVFTEAIGENELSAGEVVRLHLFGFYSTVNATDTFTARLKVGGNTVATITSDAANVSDAGVHISFAVTVRTDGASGTAISYAQGVFNNVNKTDADTTTMALDTTVAEDLTLTIEWSAADAGNTFTLTQGWAEFLG